jgi:hypothetical protein
MKAEGYKKLTAKEAQMFIAKTISILNRTVSRRT